MPSLPTYTLLPVGREFVVDIGISENDGVSASPDANDSSMKWSGSPTLLPRADWQSPRNLRVW